MGFALAAPDLLFAWGATGHQTVAFIAQDRLTPAAQKAIAQLLGPNEDLVSVSFWADQVAHDKTETATWHYFNMDPRQPETRGDIEEACPNHDCVVDQIRKDIGILEDPNASPKTRREALKFLVHFVGDLHQPLHCADDHDRGGNDKWFRYHYARGKSHHFQWVNLHSLWDGLLDPRSKDHPKRLAQRLEKEVTPSEVKEWSQGKAEDWGYESFCIARDCIYQHLPEGPLPDKNRWGKDLPGVYYSLEMRQLAERQLQKAGVRLAWLLNGIFK